MKKIFSRALSCVFLAGLIFIPVAKPKTITVTGAVVDSATGDAVSQAIILLYAASITDSLDPNNLSNLKFDSTFSGTDGKFQRQMTIDSLSFLLFYAVLKQGYLISYSPIPAFILSPTVALGKIKISKMDTSQKDTLTVSGAVVDSTTGTGIGGALVIMTSWIGFDTTGNTALTNADGTFSKQVIINKVSGASTVSFIISRQNYQPKVGQKTATGKLLDFGTINLKKINLAVGPKPDFPAVHTQANRMSVYAANGRLLYSGRVLSLDKIVQGRGNEVIVKFTFGNSFAGTKKLFFQR